MATLSIQPDSSEIADLVKRHVRSEGPTRTAIPFLSLLRFDGPTPLNQGMLRPSACFVLQGRKKILIGEEVVSYGPGSYVAAAVNLPVAGQVIEAAPRRPYLGLNIDLEPKEIAAALIELKTVLQPVSCATCALGGYVALASTDLLSALTRLVQLLEKPERIPFFAPLLKQEILYHLLVSEEGQTHWSAMAGEREGLAIGRAIEWLNRNFTAPFSAEPLAQKAGMSVSHFHRRFKAVTTLSPLQYQKHLRLLEARRLLLAGTGDVATAGFTVGYESASQFVREYRRLFGTPPRADVTNLKQQAVSLAGQD